MSEARQFLAEHGEQSIADESFTNSCVRKWDKLVGSIPQPYNRKVTAVLLENEAGHLRSLNEDTLSGNTGDFVKYIFPILRRVFPNLIANQIVSVQPMTAPVGGIFYYEYKYDGRKGSKNPVQTGIADNPYNQNYDGELNAADDLVKDFGKFYSSEFIDYDVICTNANGLAALSNVIANGRTPNWGPIRAPGIEGQRTFYVKLYYRVRDNAGAAWLDGIATLDPTGATNVLTDNLLPSAVGTFTVGTGAWTLNALDETGVVSTFEALSVVWAQYFVNFEQVFADSTSSKDKIPSVSLDITLHEVKAESRKLKARWSTEAVDDLKALHGLDAETELVSGISNEISLEIDREIIGMLLDGAAHVATYTYASTTPGELEAIRRMITQIASVSGRIHKTSGRAPANFIVTSTAVQALLDQLSTHGDYASIEQNVTAPSYGPLTANFGVSRVGTLLNKWAVYVDPYMNDNEILLGLKGNSFLDAGFVYAPYVPLQVTPTFLDPDDFKFRKGLRTRDAKKMLRPEYYGKITVSGLPTVTTTMP